MEIDVGKMKEQAKELGQKMTDLTKQYPSAVAAMVLQNLMGTLIAVQDPDEESVMSLCESACKNICEHAKWYAMYLKENPEIQRGE